jgi:hypothetical protein
MAHQEGLAQSQEGADGAGGQYVLRLAGLGGHELCAGQSCSGRSCDLRVHGPGIPGRFVDTGVGHEV